MPAQISVRNAEEGMGCDVPGPSARVSSPLGEKSSLHQDAVDLNCRASMLGNIAPVFRRHALLEIGRSDPELDRGRCFTRIQLRVVMAQNPYRSRKSLGFAGIRADHACIGPFHRDSAGPAAARDGGRRRHVNPSYGAHRVPTCDRPARSPVPRQSVPSTLRVPRSGTRSRCPYRDR